MISCQNSFVIINTKGEPLSSTENLKPLFLDAYKEHQDVSKTWEDWETYFWQHRNEDNGNDTADAGMREFFRWIMLIYYIVNSTEDTEEYKKIRENGIYKFDIKKIEYEDIKDYFCIVKKLFDNQGFFSKEQQLLSPREYDRNGLAITNQNAWYRLLPVMLYMHKFTAVSDREIQRIYQFFAHTSRLQNVQKNIRTLLPDAIKSVNEMTNADILTIGKTNTTIFTDEEKLKFDIIKSFPHKKRQELEDAIWDAENYHIWGSTIMPLIKWAMTGDNVNSFSLQTFNEYHNVVKMVFDLDNDSELDLFRRLLRKQVLLSPMPNYPCLIETFEPKSLTYKSFGFLDNEWREIIEKNSDAVRSLLDSFRPFVSNSNRIIAQMQTMLLSITTFDPMVCNPELLANCKKKLIQDGDTFNYKLVQQKRGKVAFRKSFLWYLYVKSLKCSFPKKWRLVDYYWSVEGGCTYFENDDKTNIQRLAIDVAWKPDKVIVYLFSRDEKNTKSLCQVVANKKRMLWNGERYYMRFNINSTKLYVLNYVRSLMC